MDAHCMGSERALTPEIELSARRWRPELRRVELEGPARRESRALAGDLEAACEKVRIRPRAALTMSEGRVVYTPAMHLPHETHDVLRLQRRVRAQPFFEQILDLVRHAQQHVARRACARFGCAREDLF